jgi:hypothetical protein
MRGEDPRITAHDATAEAATPHSTIDTRLTALSPLTHVSPQPQDEHSGLGPFVAAMKQ